MRGVLLSQNVDLVSVPILRFDGGIVPLGFVTGPGVGRDSPTLKKSWLSLVKATYDGKAFPPMLVPSALGMMVGRPPSMTAAAELLVPKSMPMILAI